MHTNPGMGVRYWYGRGGELWLRESVCEGKLSEPRRSVLNRANPPSGEWKMEGFTTDSSHWPIVVIKLQSALTDPALRGYLRAFDAETGAREQFFGLVLDLRAAGCLSARQRQLITNSLKRHEDLGLCRGSAVVFAPGEKRDVFSRSFWVRRPAYPTKVFTELGRARRWVEGTVLACEEPPPPPARTDQEGRVVGWVVQSGASRSLVRARKVLGQLEGSGYRPYLHRRGPEDAPMYVVRVGPFRTRDGALGQRRQMAPLGLELSVGHTRDDHRRN